MTIILNSLDKALYIMKYGIFTKKEKLYLNWTNNFFYFLKTRIFYFNYKTMNGSMTLLAYMSTFFK